jgi:hypothetical protein
VEQGEKLSRFLLHSIGILNFNINLYVNKGGAAWGLDLYVNTGRDAWETCNAMWNLGYRLSICSRTGESHGNLDRDGQSHDLLNVY